MRAEKEVLEMEVETVREAASKEHADTELVTRLGAEKTNLALDFEEEGVAYQKAEAAQ